MLAAGRKHQQRLGFQMHWIGKQQCAQLFTQWRTAGLPRLNYRLPACPQGVDQPDEMRTLAGTIKAFQRYESAACH